MGNKMVPTARLDQLHKIAVELTKRLGFAVTIEQATDYAVKRAAIELKLEKGQEP